MESVHRSFLLLRPESGSSAYPQSRAMLKLQSVRDGLAVRLTASGLSAGRYMLYLFMQDGAQVFAGDVAGGSLSQILAGVRLKNVWGAAVIHSDSLTFCLKSTGVDWTDNMMRFKLIHAKRPATPVPPPKAPAPAVPGALEKAAADELEKARDNVPANPADEPDNAPGKEPSGTIMSESAAEPDNAPGKEPSGTIMSESAAEPPQTPPPVPEPFHIPAESATDGNICESCPHVVRQDRVNPFPAIFPQSEWVKISFPGPTGWWHYITGRILSGPDVVAKAVGVPGEYGMTPPIWLEGFGTYLRCVTPDAHGYWLMFQDAETGEVLDLGLSPRDA